MKILLVNWQDPENPHAGGAEQHLFETFGRLAARGHQVRLVCSGWPGAAPRALIQGIEIERIAGRQTFALAGRGAVRRALRAARPDVLVEDVNKLPLFTPTLTDIPVLAMVPHLFGETAFSEASWPAAAIVWLAERPLARRYRRAWFQAVSESTRDDLVARGVAAERIRVVRPGVDSVRFTPESDAGRAVGGRTAAPSFVYVGRLKRYKGVDVALRALALARRTRPDLSLDVAGAGDYRAALERLAAGLGLGSAVRFRGYVSEAEKISLLRRAWANVFVSPKEGWGITVLEAGACGTPTLASDSPGLRDSVRAGETGLLVPHGDISALAGRMLALAGDAELVGRLGAAARRYAEAHTWGAAADATERQLEEISNGRS
ncbi:MAG TPA: glycosyltransferase family 4 protein [Gemmatimonadales bacterium]|nr:glycosyltransferase family 4 protein [Gemmatimonadales bacterium]